MGTVMQKRIMEVYDANKHRDTPPFEQVASAMLQKLQTEQKEAEKKRKQELINRAKELTKRARDKA